MKKLILFDLDGTLAESKSVMDSEMSSLLARLLERYLVGVMSGGSFAQFEKQFVKSLNANNLLHRLLLFPTCATSFYRFENGWVNVYSESLSDSDVVKIRQAFDVAFKETGFVPGNLFGELVENRGSQVTFSALGQLAPVDLKKLWDPDSSKRLRMKSVLDRVIPEFEVRVGGTTSIDVTRKGVDKAYGVGKIEQIMGISRKDMVFVGDALFPGGNDYPVKLAGVECISVEGPQDTKKVIRSFI